MIRTGTVLLVAAILVLLAQARAQTAAKDLPTAPDWTLKDLDGKTVRLSDFRGKVVVLNFWATWCQPCRKEIPGFVELQKKYGARGLVIVGISLDDEPGLVRPVARALNVHYPVLLGNPIVAAAYGDVTVLPSTFLINKEGKIVVLHEGFAETAAIETEVKPLL